MTLPDLQQLLRPLRWYSFKPSISIDFEDSTRIKNISLQQSPKSTVQLCDISSFRSQLQSPEFPVFGSVRTRRQDPVLQASATTFINNIQAQYPGEHFLWSDGAYSRSCFYASTASLVTLQTSSATINTTNSVTAEICVKIFLMGDRLIVRLKFVS